MIPPRCTSPSTSLFETGSNINIEDSKCPTKTAFIHLHSLVSKDISLPCPDGIISVVQQLLMDVVVCYEMLSMPKARPMSTEEKERLDLCSNELNRRLQYIALRVGDRMIEAMMWAWLHALLQNEAVWRSKLEDEKCQYLHQGTLHRQSGQFNFQAALRQINHRIEDIRALRRVTIFT
jgi:hypothetical protein